MPASSRKAPEHPLMSVDGHVEAPAKPTSAPGQGLPYSVIGAGFTKPLVDDLTPVAGRGRQVGLPVP